MMKKENYELYLRIGRDSGNLYLPSTVIVLILLAIVLYLLQAYFHFSLSDQGSNCLCILWETIPFHLFDIISEVF